MATQRNSTAILVSDHRLDLINAPYPDEHWAALAVKVFDRIEYRGPGALAYQPTREAQRNFIESTLPTYVLVGGEGLEPPTSSV